MQTAAQFGISTTNTESTWFTVHCILTVFFILLFSLFSYY